MADIRVSLVRFRVVRPRSFVRAASSSVFFPSKSQFVTGAPVHEPSWSTALRIEVHDLVRMPGTTIFLNHTPLYDIVDEFKKWCIIRWFYKVTILAKVGFDPTASGLWALHAPTAPLRWWQATFWKYQYRLSLLLTRREAFYRHEEPTQNSSLGLPSSGAGKATRAKMFLQQKKAILCHMMIWNIRYPSLCMSTISIPLKKSKNPANNNMQIWESICNSGNMTNTWSHSAGFELARGDPNRFRVYRLNRSATNAFLRFMSYQIFQRRISIRLKYFFPGHYTKINQNLNSTQSNLFRNLMRLEINEEF